MEVSSTPCPSFDESLLILSDVHLGNDLNDLDPDGIRRSEKVDTDLASLLAHYRRTPPTGKRWHLVIAGDFIDFIGMTILPRGRALDTEPSAEEREHGLGNAADHARVKLRAVAARHRVVFDALADFVAEGHALTIVHGNHDVEFHWDGVKEEMLALLLETAVSRGHATAGGSDAYLGRIEFAPWFYYVGGVAYIEHGHQYDTLCSTENGLAPVSPLDPRRIARTFSDVLLRWVVRPTRGVPEYGHDKMGLVDYVLLGARMGFGGLVRLFVRYLSAVVELFRLRRAHLSEATRALRQEHERRMGLLAEKTRLGIERLRALAALQVPPVTRSAEKILASVLLDRLAVGLLATAAIAAVVLFAPYHSWITWASIAAVGGAWAPRTPALLVAAARVVRRKARQRRDAGRARRAPRAPLPGRLRGDGAHPLAGDGAGRRGRRDLRERRLVARGRAAGRSRAGRARLPRRAHAPGHPPRALGPGGAIPRVGRQRSAKLREEPSARLVDVHPR